jgi:hypothetical protein
LTPDLLPAGNAGVLTRSDANTGVATLDAEHTILTGNKVSVCWDGGSRINMDATVAGAAVTVDGGTGDDLPAEAAAPVVLAKVVQVNASFAGDALHMVAAVADNDLAVGFYSAADALLLQLKLKGGDPQGEPWFWAKDSGVANPLAGVSVAYVLVGNGGTDAATFNLAGLRE